MMQQGRKKRTRAREPWAADLSARERQVARCVTKGHSNKDMAVELGISEKTVEKHVSRIFRKLGLSSRAQLAVYVVTGTVQPLELR